MEIHVLNAGRDMIEELLVVRGVQRVVEEAGMLPVRAFSIIERRLISVAVLSGAVPFGTVHLVSRSVFIKL